MPIPMLTIAVLLAATGLQPVEPAISLRAIGSYRDGRPGGAEIVAYDPGTRSLFVTNAADNRVDILSIADPTSPRPRKPIDLHSFGGGVNSVAVMNGLVAAAVEGFVKTDPGRVVIFDAAGMLVGLVEVGALPDMLLFTPDGRYLVVANEGEPSVDYTIDPPGSISIVTIPEDPRRLGQRHVRTAAFGRFDRDALDPSIRVFGPGASVPQDLEPEYVAISPDSSTAFVSLQENNALAVVDLKSATVTSILPLGHKDHNLPGYGLDASDRDGAIRIRRWPVFGLYQPDTIQAYEANGSLYIVSADEGDPRSYEGFDETARVRELRLDPEAFPDAESLQRDDQIGRLQVSRVMGDDDGDGLHERLFSFGGRGISIRDSSGRLVYESGDTLEQLVAGAFPEGFNSDNEERDGFDTRSDNRGPEPEALALGRVGGRVYAFVGLERVGGTAVFDITEPADATPVGYWTTRVYAGDPVTGTAGDLGPECLIFIPAAISPTRVNLLVSANEISGTVTIFEVAEKR